jgi:putative heme degradation protein
MSSLGDAKSSLGDAKSSLGDAMSSLGDAKSSLGDAESSLGDAESSLGDAESSLGDVLSDTDTDSEARRAQPPHCPRRWREWLETHPGKWVLKDSEANRGQAVHFVDSAAPRTTARALARLAEGRAKSWVGGMTH